MAEPWTDDLAALDARSRHQLRSMAATRAHILSTQESPKMRFLKNRPVLAILMLLALFGVASGTAYTVKRVFLDIDPDKSEVEIERAVKQQLLSAGVEADVKAFKTGDDDVEVRIHSTDENLPAVLGAEVSDDIEGDVRQLRLEVKCTLSDAERELLTRAARKLVPAAMMAGHDDAQAAAMIKTELANAGFHDVDVTVTETATVATIKSPPAPQQ